MLSFKENDITSLTVEGGWASDDNNSSLGEQPHTNSGTIFYEEQIPNRYGGHLRKLKPVM